jgi:uncharacterized membrane protein
MAVLIVGLILFLGVHSVKIVVPGFRDRASARIGDGPYKGLYALVSIAGFVLIIMGFGQARSASSAVYAALPGLRYLTAALMIPALVLAVASVLPPGRIKQAVRHPLLLGTILWAVSQLFVNGDLAGVVLFGTFLAWAILDLMVQPRRASAPPTPAARPDAVAIVVGLGLYAILAWRAHFWLFGLAPFA